jgi:hypothetical protein
VSHDLDRDGPACQVPAVAAARNRLDRAILAYNRHALLSEQFRIAVEHFRASKAAFEAGAADRERWREARAAAALHRSSIERSVITYVHRLRDEGVAPERTLVAVKQRQQLSVCEATPAAPSFETLTLAADLSTWAIAAYYDAA